ncbi:hypothetical protein VQ042_09875 [Aurantimonas sp. A2-1-M11]|uniref:hypothetical protein n=1 Tax=Aurantimonas sp. A2-1-M11 TaxID=3113712 RepID=UPI002F94ABE7
MTKAVEHAAKAVVFLFIIVLSPKGGVGKSLISSLLADFLVGRGRVPRVVSIDARHPTRRFLESLAVPVSFADLPSGAELAADPHAVMRAFAPVQAALSAATGKADIIIDIGSPGAKPALEYIFRSNLAKRLHESGYQPVVLVPSTAQSESLALAGDTLHFVRDTFGTDLCAVAVENQRDGALKRADDDAMKRFLAASNARLQMPVLPSHWKALDAADILPRELLSMSVDDIGRLLGENEDMVYVIRAELGEWMRQMERGFSTVLPGLDPLAL